MTEVAIHEDRLAKLAEMQLGMGTHPSFDAGVCAMEAVAWVAGEPHTDHPKCACPVIAAFVRRWNDDLDDAGRQMLKPYIAKLVGTKSTKAVESRRAWLAADWMVREHTSAWLELAGLKEQADALRAMPALASAASAKAAQATIDGARSKAAAALAAAGAARDAAGAAALAAAWDAARAAAWDTARAAAGAAAWATARDAARAAAGAAAWDTAWDAARAAAGAAAWDTAWNAARAAAGGAAAWAAGGDAAWDTAWDAARAAGRAKLEPTKLGLQQSALQLLDRMIACGAEA